MHLLELYPLRYTIRNRETSAVVLPRIATISVLNNYVRVYSVLNLSHVDKCHTHFSIPYPYYCHIYKTTSMNGTFLKYPLTWRITVCRDKLDSSRWPMWCPPLICTPKQITLSSPWLSWWFQFRHITIHDTIQYHVLYRYVKCGQHLHRVL